jgi:4-amino-4-deoxy-L-arabinose transferase-like glycosyltransferase
VAPAALFAVALVIRIAHLWAFSDSPFARLPILDAAFYDQWAREIAAGDWIGKGLWLGQPLYAWFTGLLYAAAGARVIVPLAAQCVLGAATVTLIWALAARLLPRRTALVAGGLAAVFTPFLFTGTLLLSENLTLCLNAALLVLAVGGERRSPRALLGLGALTGLAALARIQILLFAVLYAGWLLFARRERRALAAALFLAGAALPVAPVTLRNALVTGQPFLISANGGINFYLGNNPQARGLCTPPAFLRRGHTETYADAQAEAERRAGRALTPRETDAFWWAEGRRFLGADLGASLGLWARKFAWFWNGFELSDVVDFYESRTHSAWLRLPVDFRLAGPFGLLGLVVLWRERRRFAPAYLYVASQVLFALLFFVNARYRVLVAPALLVFAAAGLAWAIAAVRARDAGRMLGGGVALGLAAALTFAPLGAARGGDLAPAERHANNGAALLAQGRAAEAEQALRQALALKPAHAKAHYHLGTILKGRKDLAGALAEFRTAAAAEPRLAPAHLQVGNLLLNEHRDPVGAEAAYRAALAADPRMALARYNLGLSLLSQRRGAEAQREFAEAARLDPKFAERVPAMR